MRFPRKDIPDIADDYVLGLLENAQAADVEAGMETDDDLRAAITASRERFLPLDTGVEPAAVNDGLWTDIEARLPPQPKTGTGRPLRTANDNSRNGWKSVAVSAIAATVVMAVGLAFSLMRTVEPLVIAVLLNESGEVQAVVEDFGNERAAIRMLADFDVPRGKTIQVWTLPSRDVGPVSLGLIEGVRSTRLDGPALPSPRNDQLYEITLEQTGGSPTGRPTGPILAKGLARMPR